MKKIIKLLKNNIELFIGIIIGLFLSCSVAFAATAFYGADETSYSNSTLGSSVTTVKGALDTLYSFVANPGTLTLGATNGTAVSVTAGLYNKVNTTAVYNAGVAAGATTHTGTYTYPANSTGGTVDLGTSHTYRYVNAGNVYTKGKADGVTSHSGTYTYPANSTGGTVDLGASHTYRYVNAGNVYTKGKADGVTVHSSTYTFGDVTSSQLKKDLGIYHGYRYVNVKNVYNCGYWSLTPSLYNAQWVTGSSNTVSLGKHFKAVIVCNQCKVNSVNGASYSQQWSGGYSSYTYTVKNFTKSATANVSTTWNSAGAGWVFVLALD